MEIKQQQINNGGLAILLNKIKHQILRQNNNNNKNKTHILSLQLQLTT